MNATIPQPPGTCPGCAAHQQQVDGLQDQIEALDRGLIEASRIAHDALTAVQGLKRRQDAQDEAWALYREARAASRGGGPVPRPRRRKAPRTDRAGLTVVQP